MRGGKILNRPVLSTDRLLEKLDPVLAWMSKHQWYHVRARWSSSKILRCRVFDSPLHTNHVYEETRAHPSIVRSVYVVEVQDLLLRLPPSKRSLLFSQLMAARFAHHLALLKGLIQFTVCRGYHCCSFCHISHASQASRAAESLMKVPTSPGHKLG